MNSGASKKLCRLTAALMLSVSFAAIERAEAACNPATSAATPVNNTTVTCSGTTTNQNDPNGWGTANETGDTINVQTGATVTGTAAGISVSDGTVNNGTGANAGGTISATATTGTAVLAAGNLTVNNFGDGVTTGKIEAAGASGIAVNAGGDLTVNNSGGALITALHRALSGNNVNITNGPGSIIEATGSGSSANAIQAISLSLNNSGIIRATATDALSAIEVFKTGTVTNSGTISTAGSNGFAIGSDIGGLNLNNLAGGLIQANGNNSFAIVAGRTGTADANVTNAGMISAIGPGGIAIQASGTATVSNLGDGSTTGLITGNTAIKANSVIVSGNTGTISAIGNAIDASGTGGSAHVTNSGFISAGDIAIATDGLLTLDNNTGSMTDGVAFAVVSNNGDVNVNNGNATTPGGVIVAGGVAVQALNGTATVANFGDGASTGIIIGTATAIKAKTVVVTGNTGLIEASALNGAAINATTGATIINAGTIREDRGTAIQAGGTAHVTNLSGGNITADGTAISAISLDVTNAQGATISGGANGVSGSGTVTNAGTISGNAASVSFGGTGNNKLILQTGSVLNGDAIGALGVTNDLILQGHGIVGNNFLNFTSLDVQADTAWTWNTSANFGTTTIKSGTLAVDGTLISPVTVNAGSTLAGRGTVNGNVTVSGAVAPGAVTKFGTLTVNGNVDFQPGSIYRVNVNAAGQNDKLAVSGATNTATLSGGTVNVQVQNGVALSVPYTILSAEGGLGGTTFAGAASNFIFLKPTLSYDANDVFLTFGTTTGSPGGTIGFANVAQTRNQVAVASALDANPVSSPLVLALLNQTSAAGARTAFDALSGEVFGSVHNTHTTQMHFTRETMLGRMRQASYYGAPGELGALSFGGPELAYASGDAYAADFPAKAVPGKVPPAPRGPSRDLTFWAQGLGGWAHADSDGNAASLKSRFGGFLSGADARLGDAWRAGLVAGYMRTDLNVADRSSSAGIDSVQFGGYAGGKLGVFNVRAGASYSYDSIDTSRAIFFPGFTDKANAHFHGNIGQVFGEVGYGIALGSVALEPLAGLAYVHVRDGSFAEAGGLAALSSASANESTGYSTLGVRAATAVPLANGTVLVPRGSVQWQHAFGDVTPVNALAFQSTGASFTVAGIPIARDAALVEGGFDWRFSPQARLGAFYQGELAAHADSHAFKGAFTWDF